MEEVVEKKKIEKQKNSKEKITKVKKQKDKKKKEKKVLGVPVNFDFGEKIKDFSIETSKYRATSLMYLIVLNIMLVAVMIYFLTIIHNGLTITISIFTMLTCIIWSIMTYVFSVLKIKYTLYENAIVKNFDTSVNVGELNKLTSIKIGKTLLDKCGKHKTNSITLRFKNKWCSKITLSCINEDINSIAEQIILYSGKAKQKISDTPQIKDVKKSKKKQNQSMIKILIEKTKK